MIKYLGSKRLLVGLITEVVAAIPGTERVLDAFSGTSRVGHSLKASGRYVVANDHNAYAHTLATCYVQADADRVREDARRLIGELNVLPPRPGYFTETYCERSRYFHPRNGARVDAIRERIASLDLDEDLRAVLLVSLMEAADRVDSTTGLQMAYLKQWAPRAHGELALRLPAVLPGPGRALCLEALDAVRDAGEVDLAYLDPPYNQHSYLGNYHVWETLVRWDAPEVYGVACKRLDCRERRSDFNSRPRAFDALKAVVDATRATHLVVSFSDEGFVSREAMEAFLGERGHLVTISVGFKRYVGAQIGIYNPSGEKVGRVRSLRNTEHLYVVTPDARIAHALRERFVPKTPEREAS